MIKRRALLTAAAATGLAAPGLLATGAAGATGPAGAAGRVRSGGIPWEQLRAAVRGEVVLPGDAGYERAKQLASAQFDTVRPQAVVRCESARDVRGALLFTQDHDLPTAVRSGGHSFTGWSTGQGLVIDLSRMDRVRPSASTVHLGPAAQAVDVVTALAPLGLSVPGGFCPTVAPGGFVTGGGMGWHFRKYGPASDRLVAAQVVLADGRIVTASREHHRDLLWALRGGGGGNFGVVTDFEIAPTRERRVVTLDLTWPWALADRVLAHWQEWAAAAPADLAPRAGILLNDARPGAEPTVIVGGAHFGEQSELEALVAELTAAIGTPPTTRVIQERPYRDAMMRLFGCTDSSTAQCHLTGSNPEALLPRTTWVRHRSRMFGRPVPASGLAAMLGAFDAERRAGQYRWLGLLSLGKNANAPGAQDTAYVHRDAEFFAVYTVGLSSPQPEPEELSAALGWVGGGFAAMDPFSNGRTYVNYPDPDLPDWADAYYGQNLPRLSAVKRRYDPHGFFRSPHSIPL
ncbi:FAD-binding oxidoreductase [Streptomyces celluloflavus]|uniref:FAD-binding oxidoreductase n=1 Tax=Streptomyces celluloflavus TaxID=58344 RepID=UPI0036C186AD